MNIRWYIGKREAKTLRLFVQACRRNPFVVRRKKRNIDGERPPRTRMRTWQALAACLLTTQQRSGPTSSVNAFINKKPFPICLLAVTQARNPQEFVSRMIARFGGIRRYDDIGSELAANLRWFSGRGWTEFRDRLSDIERGRGYKREREVADWLRREFRGLGPKQSRNFIQVLGLSRYEIPIDSRITKWLNEFGFPVRLNATALSDPDYYNFVSDGLRELCHAASLYPCILDAAIFASYDKDGWEETQVIW